jgi:hypothetical protein
MGGLPASERSAPNVKPSWLQTFACLRPARSEAGQEKKRRWHFDRRFAMGSRSAFRRLPVIISLRRRTRGAAPGTFGQRHRRVPEPTFDYQYHHLKAT